MSTKGKFIGLFVIVVICIGIIVISIPKKATTSITTNNDPPKQKINLLETILEISKVAQEYQESLLMQIEQTSIVDPNTYRKKLEEVSKKVNSLFNNNNNIDISDINPDIFELVKKIVSDTLDIAQVSINDDLVNNILIINNRINDIITKIDPAQNIYLQPTCDTKGLIKLANGQCVYPQVVIPNTKSKVRSKCPTGYIINGNHCVRDAERANMLYSDKTHCPHGYTEEGEECIIPSDQYDNSFRLADCPTGYINNGINCIRESDTIDNEGILATCPDGYTNNGYNCVRGADIYPNRNKRLADCPVGYINNGTTCVRPEDIITTENRSGDCPSEYTLNGSGQSCGRELNTITYIGRPGDCPDSYTNNNNGKCVKNPTIILNSNTQKTSCPTPTTYTSTIFTSDIGGDSCSRTITISNDNVTNATCPDTYSNMQKPGTTTGERYCYRAASTKNPTTTTETLSCPDGYSNPTLSGSSTILCTKVENPVVTCPSGQIIPSGSTPFNSSTGILTCRATFGTTQFNNYVGYVGYGVSSIGSNSVTLSKTSTQQVTCPTKSNGAVTSLSISNGSGTCNYNVCTDTDHTLTNGQCKRPESSNTTFTCASTDYKNNGKCYGSCTDTDFTKVPSDGTKCTKIETINSDSMICPNTTDFVKNGSMCYGPCPTGYTRDGNNCVKSFAALDENSMTCLPTETRHGALCYTTCPTGYTDLGDGKCERPADTLTDDVMTCNDDEFKYGSRCYKLCPDGYSQNGSTCKRPIDTLSRSSLTCKTPETLYNAYCYDTCQTNYNNDKDTCYRPESIILAEDLTCDDTSYPNKYRSKCFKTCDDPYINKDDTCYRPESIKNDSEMICTQGNKISSKCYNPCRVGYQYDNTKCTKPVQKTPIRVCNNNEDYLINNTCYKPCPPNFRLAYTNDTVPSPYCLKDIDMTDTKDALCYDDEILVANLCYTKCDEPYYNKDTTCIKPETRRDPTCPPNYPKLLNGKCYR